jgi:CRISPR/Cas system CSM-associated protein Csm2 small subunit
MVETGYRYQELYWAGQDQNWEYAEYQLEKIKIAIANGLERRPKRAKSAQHFLTYVLPEMKKSLEKKDTKIFNKNFKTLTLNCNSWHAMEKVPFFSVQIPTDRQSPIKK